MPYYRVTYGGYVEGEYEDEEAAKNALRDLLHDEVADRYGRSLDDFLEVETFNEGRQVWE